FISTAGSVVNTATRCRYSVRRPNGTRKNATAASSSTARFTARLARFPIIRAPSVPDARATGQILGPLLHHRRERVLERALRTGNSRPDDLAVGVDQVRRRHVRKSVPQPRVLDARTVADRPRELQRADLLRDALPPCAVVRLIDHELDVDEPVLRIGLLQPAHLIVDGRAAWIVELAEDEQDDASDPIAQEHGLRGADPIVDGDLGGHLAQSRRRILE